MTPALTAYLQAVSERCERTEAPGARQLRYTLLWMALKQATDADNGAQGLMQIVDGDARCPNCPTLVRLVRELSGALDKIYDAHHGFFPCCECGKDASEALARAAGIVKEGG